MNELPVSDDSEGSEETDDEEQKLQTPRLGRVVN
jgi:hypothetical protein